MAVLARGVMNGVFALMNGVFRGAANEWPFFREAGTPVGLALGVEAEEFGHEADGADGV